MSNPETPAPPENCLHCSAPRHEMTIFAVHYGCLSLYTDPDTGGDWHWMRSAVCYERELAASQQLAVSLAADLRDCQTALETEKDMYRSCGEDRAGIEIERDTLRQQLHACVHASQNMHAAQQEKLQDCQGKLEEVRANRQNSARESLHNIHALECTIEDRDLLRQQLTESLARVVALRTALEKAINWHYATVNNSDEPATPQDREYVAALEAAIMAATPPDSLPPPPWRE